MEATNNRPINILSIDGGSNGLSALCMLEEMFSRLKYDIKSEEDLRPSDYFDAIGGSGTSALVALLLGRLKMTVTQAIEAYVNLAPTLSVSSTKDEGQQKGNSAAFKSAFSELLRDAGFDDDLSLLDEDSPKTLVFTLNAVSMSTPYILRSYRTRSSNSSPFTVLQAACASVASQENFAPVSIGEGHRRVTLVDATIGYANPTSELLREAKEAFGGEVKVGTILSLGSTSKAVRVDSTEISELPERGIVLQQILENCERVHNEVHRRLGENNIYHRFTIDVEPELSSHEVSSRVFSYLQQDAASSALDLSVRTVQGRPDGPTLNAINSVVPIEVALKPRPSLVRNFVGRGDILQAMRRTHFDSRPKDMIGPSISVLTGLGGSGKTQIALKFALEHEDQRSNALVYFVDGSKEATLKTDLETIIRSQGPNHRSASYEDALIWLATKSKEWLLIIDNVDDPFVKLSSFIPRCSHGHIIITTRDATRKVLAPKSTYAVEGLSTSDSVTLLLEASGYEFSPTNRTRAKEIVDELGHLPLALAHSAAYISIHQCLSTFLSMYRKSRAHVLENSPDLVHDYPRSVAATIRMSLDQLSSSARDLLRIFAHLDAGSIAYTILANAAEKDFRHVELTEDDRLQPETVEQADILMKIFCPSQEWVPATFDDIVSTCLRYSLLRVVTQNGERFYSMHVLIQNYLKDNTGRVQGHTFPKLVVRLLGSAMITGDHYYDYFAFHRLIFPHIRLISMEHVIEAGDHYGVGRVLGEMGEGIVAIVHLERCMEQWKQLRGEDNLNMLAIMATLGNCYDDLDRDQMALEIRERTLEISRRIGGDEDLDTLLNMHNLALSYSTAGRSQEALELNEVVLEKHRKMLGHEHRRTLDAMCNIAIFYSVAGREQEALELREIVLEKRRLLLGDEHRDTLEAMGNLAVSYTIVGRYQEALELQEILLDRCRVMLGDEHQDTLAAMSNLATSYSGVKREQEALELREIALEKYRLLLVGKHLEIEIVIAMNNLALSYSAVGREHEAMVLREIVLEKRKRMLGDDHRDTLLALGNLASSYSAMGREEEALPMQQFVLAKYATTLGKGHIQTLLFMCNLAQTYWKLGMATELQELRRTALPLHQKVLDAVHGRKKSLHEGDLWEMLRAANGSTIKEITTEGGAPTSDMVFPTKLQANRQQRRTVHELLRRRSNYAQSVNHKVASRFIKSLFPGAAFIH